MGNSIMNTIVVDVGVYTPIEINLLDVDFTGIEKIIFTVRNSTNLDAPLIFEREYTEPKIYNEIITPEESYQLKDGAQYDFVEMLSDGKKYKFTGNGSISLRKGVGRVEQN